VTEVSVVVAAYDEETHIAEQLEALLAQNAPFAFEVVVADNRSTDATPAIVDAIAARDPRVRRVAAAERPGMAYARNAGAAATSGAYLAFTDADDLADPGYLAALHAVAVGTGFAAGRLEHERLNARWSVAFRGEEQTKGLVERSYGPTRRYAYGNFMIRRDLHDAVGGWDETLGPSCDMDYAYRVQRDTGAELGFAPDAVLHYRHRASLRATLRQARSYGADELRVQARHAGEWREPLPVLSLPHLIARNGRRLIKPDASGGRIDPVRTRPGLAAWVWGLGLDLGRHAEGQPSVERSTPNASA
jgi:glycosyltransferase involved in cell wall biosynthesis